MTGAVHAGEVGPLGVAARLERRTEPIYRPRLLKRRETKGLQETGLHPLRCAIPIVADAGR